MTRPAPQRIIAPDQNGQHGGQHEQPDEQRGRSAAGPVGRGENTRSCPLTFARAPASAGPASAKYASSPASSSPKMVQAHARRARMTSGGT